MACHSKILASLLAIERDEKRIDLGISLPVHRGKYDAEATEAKIASTHDYQETVNALESSIREVGFHVGTQQVPAVLRCRNVARESIGPGFYKGGPDPVQRRHKIVERHSGAISAAGWAGTEQRSEGTC